MTREQELEEMKKSMHLMELETNPKVPYNYISGIGNIDERIEMLENLIYKDIQPSIEQLRKFFDYEGVFTEYIN